MGTSIAECMERVKATVARCVERQADPEFQARAAQLAIENAQAEELSRATERKMRLHASGVPMRLWDSVLKPDQTPALDAVRSHLARTRDCVFLVLSGPRGRGKTFAAAWGVAERGGKYVDAADLVHAGTFSPLWGEMQAAPVLALDELGAEYLNDAYRASLYALLNRRYADGRKTILGTNLSAPDFRKRYCPDPEDRLFERLTTGGEWVNLPGESMRKHWQDAAEDRDGE